MDVNVKKMFSLLKVPDEKIRDKMIATVKERVTSIISIKQLTEKEVYNALVKGFTEEKEWEWGILTEHELRRADELAKSVYMNDEWNFKR